MQKNLRSDNGSRATDTIDMLDEGIPSSGDSLELEQTVEEREASRENDSSVKKQKKHKSSEDKPSKIYKRKKAKSEEYIGRDMMGDDAFAADDIA